jgi:hypothetical protein
VATGAWWCAELSAGTSLLETVWPMVKRAVQWCLHYQRPGGEIVWSVDPDGVAGKFALLAASSSLQQSLACAARIAVALGHEEEGVSWSRAAARVASAVATRPQAFTAKERWAMDWYYPVLTGVLAGEVGRRRMRSRWAQMLVPGLGTRCVADKLWVTAAESAECAMAAARAGMAGEAAELLEWTKHFRAGDGGYWTGCVHPACVRFPAHQKSTYSAAAVIIADHVLYERSPAAAIFSERGPKGEWASGGSSGGELPGESVDELSGELSAARPAYAAGSPSASTAASTSLAARRPEPMHVGTPTPL